MSSELVTDLNIINYKSNRNERQNLEFRNFLKKSDSSKIARIVDQLQQSISKKIDCKECGNCCTALKPNLTEKDISRLAKIEDIPTEEFKNVFTAKSPFNSETYLKGQPCKYLKNKKCTIYTKRPRDCRDYPFLDKPNFTSRPHNILRNYSVCPIVFNVVERLKDERDFNF